MDQMRCVIKNTDGPNRLAFGGGEDTAAYYGLTHLCLTMVGKMVAMAASLGLGFVGGQVRVSTLDSRDPAILTCTIPGITGSELSTRLRTRTH